MLKTCFCSKFAVAVHRFGNKIERDFAGIFVLTKFLQIVETTIRYLSVVFCKIMIGGKAKLNQTLWLSPKGNIILGAHKIGLNCVVHHNVTLGMGLGTLGHGGLPSVGNNVWIGPDSIIHGNIYIGDGVTLLPGSVLSKSIDSNCVVAGNPARVVVRNFNNLPLRSSSRYDISRDMVKKDV